MPRTSAATALVATLAATAPAASEVAGSPITMGTLVSQAEMVRIADALDAAVDAKDWSLARSLFADTITVDFTSLVGGDPATIPADALIDGWATNLTADKTSFHLRGNHRITHHDANSATMLSHGYAWNRLARGALPENGGEAMWEVWGTYVHEFTKSDSSWKISAMTFTATAERGNPFVRNTPGS